MALAFCWMPSCSMTSSTAGPGHADGIPEGVVNPLVSTGDLAPGRDGRERAPFPIPLAMVTMSGDA
jgi:hypothetical protein